MFNGIIFNKGVVQNIVKYSKGLNLFVKSSIKVKRKDIGISISCDGVCLTLVSIKNNIKEFYLSNETIKRSKFSDIKKNDIINLELPMKYGQNISGHICQGHVDTVGVVNSIVKSQKSVVFDISIQNKFKKDLIEKASILINGVSLTISKVTKKGFQLWVIPHTLKLTNLSKLKKKDKVNIEIDILSKYVKRYVKKN